LEANATSQDKERKKSNFIINKYGATLCLGVQKSDSECYSKNYFETNIAKKNRPASRKLSSHFILAYFRNGPNAAALITPTLMRP